MKSSLFYISSLYCLLVAGVSCSYNPALPDKDSAPLYFNLKQNDTAVVIETISPFDGTVTSLSVSGPVRKIVCMSTTYVGFLEALGQEGSVCAVSGTGFVYNDKVRNGAAEAGYGDAVDYEKIVSLSPDLVLTYQVGAAEPRHVKKLRSLGISVLLLHEHLEQDPLARAAYIRLFGALTGKLSLADSVYNSVSTAYYEVKEAVEKASGQVRKVLVNAPYGDIWYVPGERSYFSRLVSDAGGVVLGSAQGTTVSGVISVEKAYELSAEADFWLNPGIFTDRESLLSSNPLFKDFASADKPIYNNTARMSPGGGNDFYESGAVRPDLILQDLAGIFHPETVGNGILHYFFEL